MHNYFFRLHNFALCARGAAPSNSHATRVLQPAKCDRNTYHRPPQAHRSSPTCHRSHQTRRGQPGGAGFCPLSELPPP